MNICVLVGKNVRRYRLAAGLSQEQLGFAVGLHRTYVSGIERGLRNPSLLVLEELATVLRVTVCDLVTDPRRRVP